MKPEEINFFMQQAPANDVSRLCREIQANSSVQLIQNPTPQTLLVPVKDPINGGEFISGEVLVTSAIVQVDGNNGWAMVMDDNPEKAAELAILDGALTAGICRKEILEVAEKGKQRYNQEKKEENEHVAATKVHFDLL